MGARRNMQGGTGFRAGWYFAQRTAAFARSSATLGFWRLGFAGLLQDKQSTTYPEPTMVEHRHVLWCLNTGLL